MFPAINDPQERTFDVMQRLPNGTVHRIGVVKALNKVLADTKALRLYRVNNIWCVDPMKEIA